MPAHPRPISRAITLALLSLVAGCSILTPAASTFTEPRYYGMGTADPEASYMAMFCPDGGVDYVMGGDIIERGTYRRRGRKVEIGRPVVVRYTLSPNEDVLRLDDTDVELRRSREFESRGLCSGG